MKTRAAASGEGKGEGLALVFSRDLQIPQGDGQNPVPTGDPAYLLTVVAVLEAGPLTATQQAGVRELQHGLQALAEAAQGGAMLQD